MPGASALPAAPSHQQLYLLYDRLYSAKETATSLTQIGVK